MDATTVETIDYFLRWYRENRLEVGSEPLAVRVA